MFFKLKIFLYLIKIKIEKIIILITNGKYLKFKMYIYLISLKKSKFYNPFLKNKREFLTLPIINKSIFMKNFNEINTCKISLKEASELAKNSEKNRDFSPMIKNIAVGLSSGTSGNQGIFLVNENERAKWVAYMLDRVIKLSFRKRRIAFFLRSNNELYEASNSNFLQFNFFDIYIPIKNHIKRLNQLKPDILIAQPSVLKIICKYLDSKNLNIKPKRIISIAEVLTNEDKIFFEKKFKINIEEVYQCTEGFLASTCKEGTLHFNEDFLIIEKKYINDEKTRFHPIITDLVRQSQPIVRYELNDVITENKKCKCGSKFLAIKSIDGRSDDIIKLVSNKNKKISIFPDIIRNTIILSDDRINDYEIIQINKNTLKLFIQSDFKQSYFNAKNALIKTFAKYNVHDINFIFKNKAKHIHGNKKRRVKNEYKK